MCFSTHFYHPETQISFVEHNDFVFVCAIVKDMSETQKTKSVSGHQAYFVLLKVDDWNKRNRTLNGIVFDSLVITVLHNGLNTPEDNQRGYKAGTKRSDTFLHVTCPFL